MTTLVLLCTAQVFAAAPDLPTAPGRGPMRPPGPPFARPAAVSSTVAPSSTVTMGARPFPYGPYGPARSGPSSTAYAATSPDGPPRPGPGPIQVATGTETWTDAPPSLPPGVKMAVLEGNPRAPGIFTIRMKAPAGFKLPVHWHPADERVTVLSGSVHVAFGEQFDPANPNAKTFPAGSFYVNPRSVRHYVWTEEETVLQITGFGPWETVYAKPADDPRRSAGGAPSPTSSPSRPPRR